MPLGVAPYYRLAVADYIRHFKRTEPSQGDPLAPTVNALTINQGPVSAVEVHMPSGHAGLTGIKIAYDGKQIIPAPPDDYYNGNKRTIRREPSESFPTGGKWQIFTYNADLHYEHTFHVDFEVDVLDTKTDVLPPVILLPFAGEPGDTSGSGLPTPSGAPGGGPAIAE